MEPNPIVAKLEPLTRLACIACGWWLLVIAAFTCVEIVGRKLFGFSLQGVDEVGGYTEAVVASFGFAHALLKRSHTRIDFLIVKLGSGARAALNVLAMVTLALMALFMVWKAIPVLAETLEFRSRSTSPLQTPLWMPQGPWLAGLVLFAASAVALAAHAVWLLVQRKADVVNDLYGPPSLEDEIDREVGAFEDRAKVQP